MQRQVFQTASACGSRVILPLSSGRFRFSYGEDTVFAAMLGVQTGFGRVGEYLLPALVQAARSARALYELARRPQ
jgi:hypothetical protein